MGLDARASSKIRTPLPLRPAPLAAWCAEQVNPRTGTPRAVAAHVRRAYVRKVVLVLWVQVDGQVVVGFPSIGCRADWQRVVDGLAAYPARRGLGSVASVGLRTDAQPTSAAASLALWHRQNLANKKGPTLSRRANGFKLLHTIDSWVTNSQYRAMACVVTDTAATAAPQTSSGGGGRRREHTSGQAGLPTRVQRRHPASTR